MKILFLAHYFPPEMGGAGARLHGLSRWLTEYGHDVTVIAGYPNYPSGVVADEYKGHGIVKEMVDGVSVVRTWVYASPRRNKWLRLANYLSFVWSSFWAGLRLGRDFDVVFASCPPLFIGVTGWLLARMGGAKFVFDIRDMWPEVAVEAGEFGEDAFFTRSMRSLAQFLYRRADHIVPVTQNKRLRISGFQIPESKISVVTNGVDLDQVPPLESLVDKRAELGFEEKFVVLYAGLIGIAQGVDVAVRAAEQLREYENIHFVIVGDGAQREQIRQMVSDKKLSNVTMLPRQPKELIPSFLNMASVSLVPLVSSNLVDAVPSKLLEAWAYCRAVILVAGGEAAGLVRESDGGLVVPPENPDELAPAILELYQNPTQVERQARSGHEFVKRFFDRPMLARQLEAVFEKLVEE